MRQLIKVLKAFGHRPIKKLTYVNEHEGYSELEYKGRETLTVEFQDGDTFEGDL